MKIVTTKQTLQIVLTLILFGFTLYSANNSFPAMPDGTCRILTTISQQTLEGPARDSFVQAAQSASALVGILIGLVLVLLLSLILRKLGFFAKHYVKYDFVTSVLFGFTTTMMLFSILINFILAYKGQGCG